MKDKIVLVDEWDCQPQDKYVFYDGKLILIPFEDFFKRQELKTFSTFLIKKESYVSKLEDITLYINYFLNFYDTEKELIMIYLRLKYLIDNKVLSNKMSEKDFVKAMYKEIFTPDMVKKIKQMTEDNYYIDVEGEEGDKYKEELKFDKNDGMCLMNISIGMKLMIPILFHYLNIHSTIKKIKLYKYYENLFEIFTTTNDSNVYDKLWLTTYTRINVSNSRDRTLWNQREIYGESRMTYLDAVLKEILISETIFKYRFHKNIVSLNYTVLMKQLTYFRKEKYKKTLIEVTNKSDSDGLSGLDKMEMNSIKIDETHIILSKLNIENIISKIEKGLKTIGIDEDEIEFYREFHTPNKIQVQLVFYHYAKFFGGYRDLNSITRKQYFKLLLMLKKKLELKRYVYLPLLLTGNVINKVNSRKIQNAKFLSKIENSAVYEAIMKNKFYLVDELDKPGIINILSTLINTNFSYVEYDDPEKTGEAIDISKHVDMLSNEVLNFINDI